MVDVAMAVQPRARERLDVIRSRGLQPGRYAIVTAHRGGNVDDPVRLAALVELLVAIPIPLVFPVHPRTRDRLQTTGLLERLADRETVILSPPLGYVEFAALVCNARAVITDSGGLQKEAYLAGVPCLTLRPNTEWTETVDRGWNVLVDLDPALALRALEQEPPAERPPLYGDGLAGERVVAALRLHAR
jgi:UDP-N-acetylglucosamine 2-epimerase (non-hydrolysing)/UDP-GlcNAc3NAcA epimerase